VDVRTPQCEVWWAGWKSDTYTLASAGWQAAIENTPSSYQDVSLILRHQVAGWSMFCRSAQPYGWFLDHVRYQDGHGRYRQPPVFEVTHCRPDTQMAIAGCMRPLSEEWKHVDIAPRWQPLKGSGIFPEWREEAREIIVAPDQVADLLERITKLQEPELQAIRERNRTRDHQERVPEIRHATILSLAA
jgi:hypothetical protein